jgi:hypothetical protein
MRPALLVLVLLPPALGAACPAGSLGSYCAGGYEYPCLAGYYGSATGQTQATCSGACSAGPGYGCPAGSVSASARLCAPGHYCPGGSPAPAPPCMVRGICGASGLSAEPPCLWNVSTLAGNSLAGGWGNGVTSTFAGNGNNARVDGAGTSTSFSRPQGLAIDSAGVLYVADTGNNCIGKVTPLGAVNTLAGTKRSRPFADGTGSAVTFASPIGVAVDASGSVYVSDTENQRVRRIAPNSTVTTLAGSGVFYALAPRGQGMSEALPTRASGRARQSAI